MHYVILKNIVVIRAACYTHHLHNTCQLLIFKSCACLCAMIMEIVCIVRDHDKNYEISIHLQSRIIYARIYISVF